MNGNNKKKNEPPPLPLLPPVATTQPPNNGNTPTTTAAKTFGFTADSYPSDDGAKRVANSTVQTLLMTDLTT